LAKIPSEDKKKIDVLFPWIEDIVEMFINGNINDAMNKYNSKVADSPKK
jgi:hypothetical protein